MISYSLNNPTLQYQGGGINPTSFQTVTTTEDKFYQTFDKTVGMVDPTGLVSTALDLLGIGPDDWADVEARSKSEVGTIISYGVKKYLQKSVPDLTGYDKYICADAQYRLDVTKTQSASNSIRRGKLMHSMLLVHIKDFRFKNSNSCDIVLKTMSVQGSGITSYKGVAFNHSFISPIEYGYYTKKSTKQPVKPVEVTGKPVTDVGTGVPSTDVNIPTDSPYFEDKPNENEGSFNWLYVIIPAVVVGVWKLGEFLIKKIKKK
ncbi:hypothetical protein [Tenacibaculum discolor]|uniref:hypothetical protein n=1 Tax=Tenacibaculum discolor TaxID=361581 RepID=UPI003F797AB8